MSISRSVKLALALIAAGSQMACVNSGVGGQVSYRNDAGRVTENYTADCNGQCTRISPDGKCVEFTADISSICLNYLSKAKLLKPVQGDNSVFIGGGVKSGGDVNFQTR